MKKILIPIDFSDNSLNALHYGQSLFEDFEVTFYLFSAYVVLPSNLLGDDWGNEWVEAMSFGVEDDLENVVSQIKKLNNNSKHQFKSISKLDRFIPSIKSIVVDYNIDFIVMGTKGVKGLKSVFLGSNAVKVINAISKCPTIVVPQDFMPKKIKQVVFSTNYKRPFAEAELKPLFKLLKHHDATLNIVQIMEDTILTEKQKTHKQALSYLLDDIPHFFHKIIYETSETKAIKDFIMKTQSDMVSFIHHKNNFFYNLTNEDVVEKTSFNSLVPLLILPAHTNNKI
ncbi:universal stress protein [Flavivirga amylovorans]|uniref:Universal stress protein n=1 Tax=Flavivirga amylovorans TaxID=870486 RepID=A0ABT8X791_9FLAO|nr:universal stress protein [Flavivirga amylovorans]MDO5989766.1 universal stress protein [Flavivirga amylovorans]